MNTLPEINSSHPKMDGWNTILSFWDGKIFRGTLAVSFREGIPGSFVLFVGAQIRPPLKKEGPTNQFRRKF